MFFILGEDANVTAEEYVVTPETIRRWVKQHHPDHVFKQGKKPLDFCANGHDMSITRKEGTDGNTFCAECRRTKQSEWARNNYHGKKNS